MFKGLRTGNLSVLCNMADDEHGYIITDELMRTNVPGVFAAGEIQDPIYRQVATSVGQGAAAGIQLERWLSEQE